jgi:hypothetical protein
MKPLTDDQRKRLTLYLGEKFSPGLVGYPYKHEGIIYSNRTFTTYEDLGKLKDKLVENGEWDAFVFWMQKKFSQPFVIWDEGEFTNQLFRPESCGLVAEYLKQKEGK